MFRRQDASTITRPEHPQPPKISQTTHFSKNSCFRPFHACRIINDWKIAAIYSNIKE